MTPKQIERVRLKISKIRKTLTAEKRKFGGYFDSGGLRYLPTQYFIQLGDYKGGLTYLRWFNKNFPGDVGSPDFLFEWTIILFKCGKFEEASKKAFEVFCANTYLFDKFFGRPITPVEKWEGSNLEAPGFTEYFVYSKTQPELSEFADWLQNLIATENFESRSEQYVEIQKRLKTESDAETRNYLIMQARQLAEGE